MMSVRTVRTMFLKKLESPSETSFIELKIPVSGSGSGSNFVVGGV